MIEQDRSHWVTHEQLDTPLCNVFSDTKTSRTARQYVELACLFLDEKPLDLSTLSYQELNEYMDELDNKVAQFRSTHNGSGGR